MRLILEAKLGEYPQCFPDWLIKHNFILQLHSLKAWMSDLTECMVFFSTTILLNYSHLRGFKSSLLSQIQSICVFVARSIPSF